MTQTFVTRTQFRLELEIGPVGDPQAVFEVVGASATFSLNRIPFASANLAVGRDARTGARAAAHVYSSLLEQMTEARLVLTPSGQWSASQPHRNDKPSRGFWDRAGRQVIFDGYIMGRGSQLVRGQLQLTVQLIHWLADLSFTSIFSEQSHPGNPANLNHSAVYSLAPSASGSSQAAFIGNSRLNPHLNEATLAQDLWQGLGNVFCDAAQHDLIQVGPPGMCGGQGERKNDRALTALARIQGTHSCATKGAARHKPLSFAGLGVPAFALANAVRTSIGQDTLAGWWGTTVWDKLINDLGPKFMFHVAPLVDTALVVPYVPGLRETWQSTITAQDTLQLYSSSYIRRPLRGVGIFAGRESQSVPSDPSSQNVPQLSGIGACFMPNPDRPGMIMLRRAPNWMANIPFYTTSALATTRGGTGAPRPTGSATQPIKALSAPDQPTKATVAVQTADVHARLAQYIYMLEVLRGRTGTLATKFRLDISPGSTVLIEQQGDPFIRGSGLTPDLVASVMSVTFGLDAQNSKAMTIFQLAHQRSLAENASDETSVESHPLYANQKFLGAPLVEDYLFSEA
jgi:hypothetical protein